MPVFSELARAQCDAMLKSHHVARLAYTFHDKVDVEPIGYIYADGGLVFRTAPGSKLETLKHHPWVAVEIDEVKDIFNWKSVVVHGTLYPLSETGTEAEKQAYHAAVDALRKVTPEALRAGDPTPFRSVVMRLECDELTGRSCS